LVAQPFLLNPIVTAIVENRFYSNPDELRSWIFGTLRPQSFFKALRRIGKLWLDALFQRSPVQVLRSSTLRMLLQHDGRAGLLIMTEHGPQEPVAITDLIGLPLFATDFPFDELFLDQWMSWFNVTTIQPLSKAVSEGRVVGRPYEEALHDVYQLSKALEQVHTVCRYLIREPYPFRCFPVFFMRTPPLRATSAPWPPVPIHRSATSRPTCSAGLLVRSGERLGVTTAWHGIRYHVRSIRIAGAKAALVRHDVPSDSCFLAWNKKPATLPDGVGRNGVYDIGVPPQRTELIFHGAATESGRTYITEVDPLTINRSKYHPGRVFTEPVTAEGDSGCALINPSDDRVVGFASECTTGIETRGKPFALWSYAASVLDALDVQPV